MVPGLHFIYYMPYLKSLRSLYILTQHELLSLIFFSVGTFLLIDWDMAGGKEGGGEKWTDFTVTTKTLYSGV